MAKDRERAEHGQGQILGQLHPRQQEILPVSLECYIFLGMNFVCWEGGVVNVVHSLAKCGNKLNYLADLEQEDYKFKDSFDYRPSSRSTQTP